MLVFRKGRVILPKFPNCFASQNHTESESSQTPAPLGADELGDCRERGESNKERFLKHQPTKSHGNLWGNQPKGQHPTGVTNPKGKNPTGKYPGLMIQRL